MTGCALRTQVQVRPATNPIATRGSYATLHVVHHTTWHVMTLGFQYPVAVYRLASKDAYEACDFTAAQLLLAGGEYVLSESFLTEGSNYFASEEECEAGLKFEASSAEYTNYAGFSWPVNAP
eukprot:7391365-Prymnesium_polylepis.1